MLALVLLIGAVAGEVVGFRSLCVRVGFVWVACGVGGGVGGGCPGLCWLLGLRLVFFGATVEVKAVSRVHCRLFEYVLCSRDLVAAQCLQSFPPQF